jgi:hypothetical protein
MVAPTGISIFRKIIPTHCGAPSVSVHNSRSLLKLSTYPGTCSPSVAVISSASSTPAFIATEIVVCEDAIYVNIRMVVKTIDVVPNLVEI